MYFTKYTYILNQKCSQFKINSKAVFFFYLMSLFTSKSNILLAQIICILNICTNLLHTIKHNDTHTHTPFNSHAPLITVNNL